LQSDEAYEEYLAAMEKKDIEYSWFNGNTGNFEWEDLDLTKLFNTVGTEYRLKVRNINNVAPITVTNVSQGTPTSINASTDTQNPPHHHITINNTPIDLGTEWPDSVTVDGVEYPITESGGIHSVAQYTYSVMLPDALNPISAIGSADSFTFTNDGKVYTVSGFTSGTAKYAATTPSTEEFIECNNLEETCAVLGITVAAAKTDKVVFRDLIYNAYAIIEAKLYDEDLQKHVWKETSVATNVGLRERTDDKELAKAEAEYEAALRRIDKKEEQYDKDLAKFDQERKALTTQLDTLKTCIKENIDRTFKIFQG